MLRWIVGKHGDVVPLLVFVFVLGFVYVFDREKAVSLNGTVKVSVYGASFASGW